jgi:hypothetical protein
MVRRVGVLHLCPPHPAEMKRYAEVAAAVDIPPTEVGDEQARTDGAQVKDQD